MDVDDLGKIFGDGLGKNSTISRVSTLSSMFSMFFEGYLNNICKEYENKVYIIYSGGDDLFIVGSWDVIPEVAKDINEKFRKFTCNNPNITLSGGISIEKCKYPLYKGAENAHNALESSKAYKRNNKEVQKEKDAINFLNKTLDWHDFGIAHSIKENLYKNLKIKMPRGILNRLGVIYSLYIESEKILGEKYLRHKLTIDEFKKKLRYEKWRWRLTYSLHRYIEQNKDFEPDLKNIENAILNNEFEGEKSILKIIEYLGVPARWAEFLTRTEVERCVKKK